MTTITTAPAITDLADEIGGAIHHVRHRNAEEPDEAATADELTWHERTACFDAIIALLIRNRLPIDADAVTRTVRLYQCEDIDTWAGGCAQYIESLIHHQEEQTS